jgi:hypothetical protein
MALTGLFGALAAGSLLSAVTGDHALWFGFAIFGAAFAGCALVLRRRGRGPRPGVAFTATGMHFPEGWWKTGERQVAYGDVTDLVFVRLVGVASGEVRGLEVCSSRERFRLARDDFAEGHFLDVCDQLLGRVSPGLARAVGPAFWLNEANHLDRHGEWARAMAYYQRAAEALRGQPDGEYAENCGKRVREKMTSAPAQVPPNRSLQQEGPA